MSVYNRSRREWEDGVVCKGVSQSANGTAIYRVQTEAGERPLETPLPHDSIIFLAEVQVQLERQRRKKTHDLQVLMTALMAVAHCLPTRL